MTAIRPSSLLRLSLLADAVVSGATGVLMIAGAGMLAELLALPAALLRYAGLVLLPYAAFVGWLGSRERMSQGAVWFVVVCNLLWALDCVLLLLTGWIAPNALGIAFVVVQAVVVAAFAEAQWFGLRRSGPARSGAVAA